MIVRRRPYLDEYVEGGESAVLIDDQVFVLSPLATTILAVIGDRSASVTEVADVLLDAYGEPPDGSDLVAATTSALESLAESGLVEMSQTRVTEGKNQPSAE